MAIINTQLAKMEMQILQRSFYSTYVLFICRKSFSGLGTSTAKEAKEYFSNMDRHRIIFKYDSIKDDLAIQLAFNSALSDDRKDWIKWHTEDVNQRREQNLPADYLYKKDTKQINFNDFINKELVLFSKSSTERAIPSIMVKKSNNRKIFFFIFLFRMVLNLVNVKSCSFVLLKISSVKSKSHNWVEKLQKIPLIIMVNNH